MFMRGCEISPSSIAWLGVGKACMGLEDLKEAEDALSVSLAKGKQGGELFFNWVSLFYKGSKCLE